MLNENWLNTVIRGQWKETPLGIDVIGDIYIKQDITQLPVKFNNLDGNFYCTFNKLTTLYNFPNRITKTCMLVSNRLTSLKYCPVYIGQCINISHNNIDTLFEIGKTPSVLFHNQYKINAYFEINKLIERACKYNVVYDIHTMYGILIKHDLNFLKSCLYKPNTKVTGIINDYISNNTTVNSFIMKDIKNNVFYD